MAAEEFGAEEEFALEEEEVSFDFEDEFDRLREKTSRTSAVYDDMDLEDELEEEEPQGFLAQITPVQRLILLVLLLLDIVVIAIGTMAVFRII